MNDSICASICAGTFLKKNKRNMENKITKANDCSFPVIAENYIIDGGLTKREYFAAKAMQGIIANKDGLDIKIERIVESAVDTADALLKN
jgi:hypothetical protein